VAHDRAGLGASDPGPSPPTADLQVADLATMAAKTRDGPAVVVGHSWGRLLAQLLAFRHPDQARPCGAAWRVPRMRSGTCHAWAFSTAFRDFFQDREFVMRDWAADLRADSPMALSQSALAELIEQEQRRHRQ
jgi:pimeloyl-ACP methyl ester carboxylesterase